MKMTTPSLEVRKLPKLFVISGLFLLASILFSVIATASISTVGSEIHSLQVKTKSLQKQNDTYQMEIANAQSLEGARLSAQALGFVPIEKIITLDTSATALALK